MSEESLKQKVDKKAICGRILDNEPIPMKGCKMSNCEKCKLRSKITQYIVVDDVFAVLDEATKQIQPTMTCVIRLLRNFASLCKSTDIIESTDFNDLNKWANELERFWAVWEGK